MTNPDFRIVNRGTVWTFEPVTDEARNFVARELQIQDGQWRDASFGVDDRPAHALFSSLAERGFALCRLLAH